VVAASRRQVLHPAVDLRPGGGDRRRVLSEVLHEQLGVVRVEAPSGRGEPSTAQIPSAQIPSAQIPSATSWRVASMQSTRASVRL
ncbi:MAG: hypothetical protein ACRDUV_06980, partial [Pseudonocardiaceae bacterium]